MKIHTLDPPSPALPDSARQGRVVIDMDENKKGLEVSLNLDTTPILYTDNVTMVANEDGVMLDVCQKIGVTKRMRIVSRIGMSRTHAKKFVKELSNLLAMTEGKKQSAN